MSSGSLNRDIKVEKRKHRSSEERTYGEGVKRGHIQENDGTADRTAAVSGERRSLIGRPGAAWAYETADWLSAVDSDYKRPNATVMSSIGLGGSWETDQQTRTNRGL